MKTFAWAVAIVCVSCLSVTQVWAQGGRGGRGAGGGLRGGSGEEKIDPTITSWDEKKINQPPERTIKFRERETAAELILRKDGDVAALREQKYLVILQLKNDMRSEFGESSAPLSESFLSEGKFKLQLIGNHYLLDSGYDVSSKYSKETLADSFKRWLQAAPESKQRDLNKLDSIKFLTSDKVGQEGYLETDRSARPLSLGVLDIQSKQEIRFIAPNIEAAKECSTTLLTLLDYGFSRPLQQEIWLKREEPLKAYRDQQALAVKTKSDLEAIEKELKPLQGYSPEMQGQLQLQRLQFDSDRVALKAKIVACKRLLENKELAQERRTHIENVQTTAEIDLAALEAREETINAFYANVTKKTEYLERQLKLTKDNQQIAASLRMYASQLQSYNQALDRYAPIPLVADTVLIKPIEWKE